ncbi:MAG: hypothetical protein Q7S27_02765 [Nanoarchaeota archaeon]|nr:hypothetical protein [Nanoarchaeota archaeon]
MTTIEVKLRSATVERTPLINPYYPYGSIDEDIKAKGYSLVGEVRNESLIDFLKQYADKKITNKIQDFKIVPSALAREGTGLEGSDESHIIYVRYS